MESLIETFNIDISLLVAQMVNFAIVISVLYFFALKPLIATMQDRTKKIEKSLDDAKRVEEKLNQTEADYDKKLTKAKKEAAEIMEKAQKQAEEKREQMITKAKADIGQIINDEKARMQQEKKEVLREIKADVADLVAASLEKVLEEKVDSNEDKKLISRVVGSK